MHITIVDDIKENLELYEELLRPHFEVKTIQNPQDVLHYLGRSSTDLVLLDLHMPSMNGFTLYGKINELHPDTPIIFLTGDPSEDSMVRGLNLGADDFIVKPVSLKELLARINNRIARSKGSTENSTITIGGFTLHCDMQLAEIEDKKIQLTPIEFKLINLFAKNPNKLYSRDYISKLLWPDVHVQNQNIDTHLSNLRKKLAPFSENIKTIKSRGYILRV